MQKHVFNLSYKIKFYQNEKNQQKKQIIKIQEKEKKIKRR